MTIKTEIMQLAQKRRDKRLRILLTDEEYSKLLSMAIAEDLSMVDIIRRKVFKEEEC
jgi:hypothetical protein